jgi:hypothetical protein
VSLLLGIAFCLFVLAAGHALLALVPVPSGLLRLGLAAPVGLGSLAVLTTWTRTAGLPAMATTALASVPMVYATVRAAGWGRRGATALDATSESRRGLILLVAALALAALVMGVGFAGVDAPLSTHDGAFHVETIDAARRGLVADTWYPTGLHTTMAAFLGLVPWVDTAEGAFGASLGLTLLAVVAVFSLSYAVWGSPLTAGAGALMVALTFQYPYHIHFWGGWPLAAAIVVVLGVLTVALLYLRRPGIGLAFSAGVLAAGIVLIHGTEVYSAAIGLLVLLVAGWRRLRWRQLCVHAAVALVIGLVCAAPYASTLLHWAAAGGASAIGSVEAQAEALSSGGLPTENLLVLMFNTFGTGVGLDLPLRIGLLVTGVWCAARGRTGQAVVALGAIFLGLALAFATLHGPLLDGLYAITFPWAQSYRLLMIVALAAGLLQGLGGVAVSKACVRMHRRWSGTQPHWLRRVRTLAWLLIALAASGSVASLALLLSANTRVYASTSPDDQAAMVWLRAHARPGEVLANDRFADAGIWAPYKAGVPVLLPRLGADHLDARLLVLDNIGRPVPSPESQTAACALGARYVFHGSRSTAWERRHFPPLPGLEQSQSLEEVFVSGGAVLFKMRLPCDG